MYLSARSNQGNTVNQNCNYNQFRLYQIIYHTFSSLAMFYNYIMFGWGGWNMKKAIQKQFEGLSECNGFKKPIQVDGKTIL